MEIIKYDQEKHFNLIKEIYSSYPDVIKIKIKELKKINSHNPFFKFGSLKNFLLSDNGKVVVHASAIIDSRLGKDLGLVGSFESINNPKYAEYIFVAISDYFKDQDKKFIRGPINLTTWQNWRISFPEGKLPFTVEPFTREYYKDLFESYGFDVGQENITTISNIDESGFKVFQGDFQKIRDEGFTIVNIDKSNQEKSLEAVYEIIAQAFIDSWTFVKISIEEFIYNHTGSSTMNALSYSCLILNKEKKAVAFCFAVKDNNQNDMVIIKTFAVKQEYQGRSIGKAMFYWVYQKAKLEKIKNLMFCTMRSDNTNILKLTQSKNIYRRYRVYQKKI